jgi:hypothetical protein
MTDDELLQGFEAATLPGECFHHEEHVRVAFLYLQRYSALEALEQFANSLKRFAARQGKADRYHETITWAYLLLIRERMARAEGEDTWMEFRSNNADLFDRERDILKKYYREETLASGLARRTFILPDAGKGSQAERPELRVVHDSEAGTRPH